MAGVPKIYSHVVGLGTAFIGRNDARGRLLELVSAVLYRFVGLISKSIWFTNKNDLRFFVERGFVSEAKTVLTPNYLDVSEYDIKSISAENISFAKKLCGVKEGDQVVIMVARLIWAKGIREFAEAAEILFRSHPHLKFILVAPEEKGSYGAVPVDFVREKEKTANFSWLGFQEQVRPLYAIADLAVLPTFYKEGGYPRALLEPMAMGKPVITTNSEDCRAAVEEARNGFLVPVRDSVALASAIAEIMNSDKLREDFGSYSRVKAVRDFDETVIVPVALRQMGLPV
jgi:glycosyltransferase involved in cell wall biosynthesis